MTLRARALPSHPRWSRPLCVGRAADCWPWGGRFVAALDVAVLALVGDGKRRIDELLDALNRDSFRNGVRPYQVKIDGDLRARLARAGCALDDLLTWALESAAHGPEPSLRNR